MYNSLWLDYKKLEISSEKERELVANLNKVFLGFPLDSKVASSIVEELKLGLQIMLDKQVEFIEEERLEKGIHLLIVNDERIDSEGYEIASSEDGFILKAVDIKGLLYATFRFLNLLRMGELEEGVKELNNPSNPLRMFNHWDNMPGDIERGYSGNSFFFEDNKIIVDDRTKMYARALASIGINGIVINNVNVKGEASFLISDKHYEKLAEMSDIFSAYGVSLFLSINYALPLEGELGTADPLDISVIKFWENKCKEVYEHLPKLGGFLVKADSEGRPGPFTYGRTQADGANMLARAIKPYGGLIIWRCFVYNCRQDWRDLKTDRARAGYDYFHGLDGEFEENVILQIKNGPMDFQVREPVSPLFGGMEKTNEMLEVQIAQEYTGQQRHVCYLIPWFKEILSFNTHYNEQTVGDIVSGKTFKNKNAGMTAVCNTGNDYNWTGHDLAMANLYGFGRLSFDINLSSEDIASEWIKLYLANALGKESFEKIGGPAILEIVRDILMNSWPTYEKYNAPLGIGWMVCPNHHYGPDVDGYEYSVWGTYHKADLHAIGIDRTDAGTGFTSQYRKENKDLYDDIKTCPENLLLFFHRMPYTYELSSGKTIIQHIYDTHFEGAKEVEIMKEKWEKLKDLIADDVYDRVLERMEHQVMHSKEWRDVINSYFYRKTGIEDKYKRPIY